MKHMSSQHSSPGRETQAIDLGGSGGTQPQKKSAWGSWGVQGVRGVLELSTHIVEQGESSNIFPLPARSSNKPGIPKGLL